MYQYIEIVTPFVVVVKIVLVDALMTGLAARCAAYARLLTFAATEPAEQRGQNDADDEQHANDRQQNSEHKLFVR